MKAVFLKAFFSAFSFPAVLILGVLFLSPIPVCFMIDTKENGLADMFMMGMMLSMFGVLFSVIMQFDEETGWNKFLLTTPIPRKKIILARYLMTVTTSVLFILMASIPSIVLMIRTTGFDLREWLFLFSSLTGIGALVVSFIVPLSVRFGRMAGLVTFVIVFMVLLIGGVILSALLGKNEAGLSVVSSLIGTDKYLMSAVILLISVVMTVLSLLITVSVYKRKEF